MARRPTEGPRDELTGIIASARMHLEMEHLLGAEHLPFSPARVKELRGRRRAAVTASGVAKKATELEKLRSEPRSCCRCGLGKGRINLVFGVGRPDADLMFIGEGPGQQEDEQGIPFVGLAGQLLTKIIEAIGLTRDEVYIANIVKCRPPGNRAPLPEESALCLPFLRRQIEIIQPRIIGYARQRADADAAPDDRGHHENARRVRRARRHPLHAHLPSRVSPPGPEQEERGLGGHEEDLGEDEGTRPADRGVEVGKVKVR